MAENTFLGLQPYTEADAYRFKGRAEESQELFRLILRNDYTVCYAESGEGKTSLLNAGVFPLLRQNLYFPIEITFTSDDYQNTHDSFDEIINHCIENSIKYYNEKNKGINIKYELCSTDFQDTDSQSALQQELSKYSWWRLRNYKPQAMGLTFTPVFIFDQFEEVFNLPESIVWTKDFFDWLENVSSDSCPDEIIKKVRTIIGTNAAFPAIKEGKDFKAVFSLRKEFIGELDYWGMQQCFIPSLKDNRYCLKALTYEGAKKVMTQQQRFEHDKVEQVLHHFVQKYSREPEKTIDKHLPVIPALLLSVVCDSWEKDIHYFSGKDENEIGKSLNNIIEQFYNNTISKIVNDIIHAREEIDKRIDKSSPFYGIEPLGEVFFRNEIEELLILLVDRNGKRERTKTTSSRFSQIGFDEEYKNILCDNRIIKVSKIDGEDYVEIVHDALCPIIAKRKEQKFVEEATRREEEKLRREEEKLRKQAQKSRKRMMVATAFGIAIIAILLFFLWQNNRFLKEQEARNLSETENASLKKANDSILCLNDSLNTLIQINNQQKDSLKQKNLELERSLAQIREQKEEIKAKDEIINRSRKVQVGYVKTKGRIVNGQLIKGLPISGATVRAKGHPPVMTDKEGKFTLNVEHGNKFQIISVGKSGYRLTDPDVILRERFASNDPLVIVVSTLEELDEDELVAYRKISKYLQNKISTLEDSINQLKTENELLKERLRN